MALNLNEILQLVNSILGEQRIERKELSYEQFNYHLKLVNIKKFKKECSEDNRDNLKPFIVFMGGTQSQPLLVNVNGYATRPSDFYKNISMTYKHVVGKTINTRIVYVKSDEIFDDLCASTIDGPTKYEPIAKITETQIVFEPINVKRINFTYIKNPTTPVFAIKITSGFNEYDADNSTELEWDDENTIDIIVLLLQQIGVSITSQEVERKVNQQK